MANADTTTTTTSPASPASPASLTDEQARHLQMLTDLGRAWQEEADRHLPIQGIRGSVARQRSLAKVEAFRQAHALATAFYRQGNDPEFTLSNLMP